MSSNLVVFTSQALPEQTLNDTSEIQALFSRVISLELPGFVIRQCGDIDKASACLGTEAEEVPGHPGWEFEDSRDSRGLHLDVEEPFVLRRGLRQFNLHCTSEGSVQASLFALPPDVRAKRDAALKEKIKKVTVSFRVVQVDSSLLIPVAHTAILRAGDALVFTDTFHAHAFRSLHCPRYSKAKPYGAPLPT